MPQVDRLTLRQVARAYLISIAIWCGLSVLTGWNYFLFDRALNIPSTVLQMLLYAEARGLSYAILTPPIFYLVRRFSGASKHRVRYLLAFSLGVLPFMLLYVGVHWLIIPPWDLTIQSFVSRSGHNPLELIYGSFADQITMYIAIVVAAHGYEYFQRTRRQELERCEYQQALAASELQTLKMQLHPHFLFNTLHGIATLTDSDPATAKAMIVKLSSLLRTALQHSGSDLVPFEEELRFIREYLELEMMRLGPRLTVRWSIAPDTYRVLVPQLILQPLVENAIRHGIARSREAGWVEISSHKHGDLLQLQVSNSTAEKNREGTGVGLQDTEARLKHLYSDEADLSFAMVENQAVVVLRFPALGATPLPGKRFSSKPDDTPEPSRPRVIAHT